MTLLKKKVLECIIKGGSSAGAPGARPPVWNFLRVYFNTFWLHNMHRLYCNHMQYLQYIFESASFLYNDERENRWKSPWVTDDEGMCEGASKQYSYLKNYTASGQRLPVLKFLDPPLIISLRSIWTIYRWPVVLIQRTYDLFALARWHNHFHTKIFLTSCLLTYLEDQEVWIKCYKVQT